MSSSLTERSAVAVGVRRDADPFRTPPRRGSLAGERFDPSVFDEHALRVLWRFRGQFMKLKPHIDPEDDFRRFSSFLRASHITWIERGRDDELLAMVTYRIESLEHEGHGVTVLWPEYVFVARERRQSWQIALSFMHAYVAAHLRSPGRPIYLFGIGYLPSYLAIQEGIDLWLHDGAGMAAWERRLRERLSARVTGWDPETGNIHMPTIPLDCREAWPRRPSSRLAAQRYLAQNPRWREGIAAVLFARLDATVISRGVRLALQRRAQRR